MSLDQDPNLLLVTSTVSDGNMSYLRGDTAYILQNRQKFLQKYGLNTSQIICMSCQHQTDILLVGKKDLGKGAISIDDAPKVDGLITQEKGIHLFLLTADCLPIAIFDPQTQSIGLIHAGWKGLDQGIIQSAIESFLTNFNSKPHHLLVYIGPSLGLCCNRGREGVSQINDPKWQNFLSKEKDGSYAIDLWSFAENELINHGVKKENITNPKVCTYHDNSYFSNRRYHVEKLENDYRFATVLGFKNLA